MNRNKLCPDCETEYLPHIEKCADCGTVLLLHEEYRKAREQKSQLTNKAITNTVVVREGDLKWVSELHNALTDAGIPCMVSSNAGCKKGCGGGEYKLVVAAEDLERARERIEEYFVEMHPEIQASNELISQGKCPACGSPVGADDTQCSDCGLALVIFEEEEEE